MLHIAKLPSGVIRLRELNHKLDLEEQSVNDFFSLSPDILAVIRLDGSFAQINASWHKLLGWDLSDVLDSTWYNFIDSEQRERVEELIKTLRDKDVPSFVLDLICKDGSKLPVEFSATKWARGCSHLTGRPVFKNDVTSQLRSSWSSDDCCGQHQKLE